jgi:hypothetical protein
VLAYKPAQLPPELRSPDASISEVMAFRHESAATVFRKIRAGTYRSHKNGDSRLIEWASVLEDRANCLAAGPQLAPQTGKPGRPPKAAGQPVSEPHPASSHRKRKRESAPAAE